MHVNRGLLNWGVFFLLLGAIPIAVRLGLIPEATVARAWTLWPLLLIAGGVGAILSKTRFDFVGGLIAAVTFGIIGGGLLASGQIPFASCGDDRGAVAFPARQGELGPEASVEVRLDCGELALGTTSGTAWSLEGVDDDGSGPRVEATASSLKIESDDPPGFAFAGSRDRWTLTLGSASKIDLETTINAGEARLGLRGANLGQLRVGVNAGQATVDLGAVAAIAGLDVSVNAGEARVILPNLGLRGSVEANAGTIQLCAPATAGLRIRMDDNITASNNFAERGLVETSENVWETPGYASAGVQLEIDAEVNAGGIDLEPAGTCGA